MSTLEKKLGEVTERLKEETSAKEYNWKTIDLLILNEKKLEEEKVSLIRRLAKEIP